MTTVRPARLDDVPALLALVEGYWRFEGIDGFDAARVGGPLRQLLANESLGAAWIAEVDGTPAGYVVVMRIFSLEFGGPTIEIDEIYVAPDFRGRGLGAALLDTVEAHARATGCGYVALRLGSANDAGRAFYHSRGYATRAEYEIVDKILT